jgi:hypothetical protein
MSTLFLNFSLLLLACANTLAHPACCARPDDKHDARLAAAPLRRASGYAGTAGIRRCMPPANT